MARPNERPRWWTGAHEVAGQPLTMLLPRTPAGRLRRDLVVGVVAYLVALLLGGLR